MGRVRDTGKAQSEMRREDDHLYEFVALERVIRDKGSTGLV